MSQTVKDTLLHSVPLRMALLLALCIGGGTACIAAAAVWLSRHSVEDQLRVQARSVSELVADQGMAALAFRDTRRLDALLGEAIRSSGDALIWAQALDAEGRPLASRGEPADEQPLHSALVQQAISSGSPALSSDGLHIALPVFRDDDQRLAGVFALGWNSAPALAMALPGQITLLLTALCLGALLTAVGLLLVRMLFLRPLSLLATGPETVAAKILAARGDNFGQVFQCFNDLRERLKRMEKSADENAAKATGFTATPTAALLLDEASRIASVNPAMIIALHAFAPELDAQGLVGRGLEALPATLRDAILQSLRSGEHAVASVHHRSIRWETRRLKSGPYEGHLVTATDVTQDLETQATVEAVDGAMARADFEVTGKLLSANALFLNLMGWPPGDVASRSLPSLTPDGEAERMMQQALRDRVSGTLTVPTGSGMISLECSLTCLRDSSGQATRFLLLAKDVTQERNRLDRIQEEWTEMQNRQAVVVDALRIALRQLSAGDLTSRIEQPFDGRYDELRQDYNRALNNLADVMRNVIGNAESIRNEARDISSTAHSLAQRTENTAATLEQTAAALDGLTVSVRAAADGAAEADRVVTEAKSNAEQSGNIVVETVTAMDMIEASSDKITSIVKVIDDIAFQTNLLALNAGVEAARAGDAGRGFAVVASEVRALAQRSSEAAREINDLILKSGSQVKRGVDLVGRTGEALKQIVNSVSDISLLVSEIAVSSKQQSLGLAEINSAVNDLDQSTQQNAARLQEATAAAEALTNDAIALVESAAHFRLDGDGGSTETVVSFRARNPQGRTNTAAPRVAATGTGAAPSQTPTGANSGWEDF